MRVVPACLKIFTSLRLESLDQLSLQRRPDAMGGRGVRPNSSNVASTVFPRNRVGVVGKQDSKRAISRFRTGRATWLPYFSKTRFDVSGYRFDPGDRFLPTLIGLAAGQA